ncbi:MAG: chromate transporter [Fibrobacteria bacterium]
MRELFKAANLANLAEVSGLFLKLGATAFGGPAAHIALMRREAVERRKWLSEEAFLDLLGATNLIPGPNSTEMAIHLGYLRAGWPGLIAAGTCFIVPAMLLVSAMAWAYARSGALPQLGWLLYGVKPVVVALILHAVWNLGRTALNDAARKIGFVAVLAWYFAGANEIALLFGTGLAALALSRMTPGGKGPGAGKQEAEGGSPRTTSNGKHDENHDGNRDDKCAGVPGLPGALLSPLAATVAAVPAGCAAAALPVGLLSVPIAAPLTVPFTLTLLFLKFLKIGSVLYGSGYVLLPFLRAEFVQRTGWLTESQVMDAVAVGQFTPGPFFTTGTFIGHVLGGFPGGALATLGIFLPAFVFVAIANPWIPRLRRSDALGRVLDGVNTASLALMAGAAWQTGKVSVTDGTTAALLAAALYLLFRRNVPGTWLIAGGGLIGMAVRSLA